MAPDAHSDGTREQSAAAVEEAITSRRSIRRFLPTPVDRALVERILTVASRAPSDHVGLAKAGGCCLPLRERSEQ